jgi:hypothetical protein
MGSSSAKKTPAKAGKSATHVHDNQDSQVVTPSKSTPGSSKKKGTPNKDWNFTHHLPNKDTLAKNGRHEGRNLITWTRKRSLPVNTNKTPMITSADSDARPPNGGETAPASSV